MPYSLAQAVHSELIIKKSRFIGCVAPCADRATALKRLQELRAQHVSAVHVCWALLAGGQSAAVDDGEPSGTAGRPMLEVMRHQDLEGVLATVARYWGGVKLGAGGLVRSYTDSVAQALLSATKLTLQRLVQPRCTVPYAQEGVLRRELDAAQATLTRVEHGSQVELWFSLAELWFSLAESGSAALINRLKDATQRRIGWLTP